MELFLGFWFWHWFCTLTVRVNHVEYVMNYGCVLNYQGVLSTSKLFSEIENFQISTNYNDWRSQGRVSIISNLSLWQWFWNNQMRPSITVSFDIVIIFWHSHLRSNCELTLTGTDGFDFCILYLCYISFCICAAGKERYFSGIVLKWKLPFCLVHTVAGRQFHFYNTRQQCRQNKMDSFSIVFLSFFLQRKTNMFLGWSSSSAKL